MSYAIHLRRVGVNAGLCTTACAMLMARKRATADTAKVTCRACQEALARNAETRLAGREERELEWGA